MGKLGKELGLISESVPDQATISINFAYQGLNHPDGLAVDANVQVIGSSAFLDNPGDLGGGTIEYSFITGNLQDRRRSISSEFTVIKAGAGIFIDRNGNINGFSLNFGKGISATVDHPAFIAPK